MLQHQVRPEAKTLGAMLQLLPNGAEHEKLLLDLAAFHRVDVDVDLVNVLIRRRLFRRDFQASEVSDSVCGVIGMIRAPHSDHYY